MRQPYPIILTAKDREVIDWLDDDNKYGQRLAAIMRENLATSCIWPGSHNVVTIVPMEYRNEIKDILNLLVHHFPDSLAEKLINYIYNKL